MPTQCKRSIGPKIFKMCSCLSIQTAVPSGPPLSLNDADVGSRSVLLTWAPPHFYLQNGHIGQYVIRVTHNQTGLTYTVVSMTNERLLQNLFPFNTYVFEVAAETTAGVGPYSSQLIVTLLEDGEL